MLGIKYFAPFDDPTGYGDASRQFIASLFVAGVDITTELVVQFPGNHNYGWVGNLCHNLMDRNIPYNIKIHHVTPDMIPRYYEKGKHNISHLFWETDRLPQAWVEPLNKCEEIWTSSDGMADLFRNCGVKVPIYAFPQPIDIAEADNPYERFDFPEHKGFLFYSIFQWIERKNPKMLLQAYWEAFTGRQDVTLLLKTYRVNYTEVEYDRIKSDIERWKRESSLVHFPRVLLTTKILTHEDIMRLHFTGDAYVSADHGEGWCRPLQEALLMGKPAITTARGGIHEYLTHDLYYPIQSTYVPVVAQPWIPWYSGEQNWAQIDKEEFKRQMKFVFLNKNVAQIKGYKAKDFVKTGFNYHTIGKKMYERLAKIQKAF